MSKEKYQITKLGYRYLLERPWMDWNYNVEPLNYPKWAYKTTIDPTQFKRFKNVESENMSKAKINLDIYVDENVAKEIKSYVEAYSEKGLILDVNTVSDIYLDCAGAAYRRLLGRGIKTKVNSIKLKEKWNTIYKSE